MGVGFADRAQLAVFVVLVGLLAMKKVRTSLDASHPLDPADDVPALQLSRRNGGSTTQTTANPIIEEARSQPTTPEITTHIGVRGDIDTTLTPSPAKVSYSPKGCGVMGPHQEHETSDANSEVQCASDCAARAYSYFGLLQGKECWCADDLEHLEILPQDGCKLDRQRHTQIFHVEDALPEIITMFIAPAKRTSSLFTSGRLEAFFSGKYAYRYRKLNAGVFRTDVGFRKEMCETTPGKKIFVQITGAVTKLLLNWPDNSVLIMTADEIGNWGLGKGDRRFGPHGKGRDFPSNETSEYKHIILPKRIFPMFKQYHHFRQAAAFGDSIRFVPLGSRNEYPNIPPNSILPAPERRYVFSYMAALTDATRKKVYDILSTDKEIPSDKRFIQVSQSWHGSANNDEYVSPAKYQEVMLNSVFAICPKGHSVEQFRIYEAIEAGAIPVMDLKEGYLAQHLPAEYLTSPMLLLNGWDTVVDEMVKLWKNPSKLRDRQQNLLRWYDNYMRTKVREIETVLESRSLESPEFCAKTLK